MEYLRDAYRIRESEFLGFDAMRNAAQCVGRVLRGKTDWGLMVFADKVRFSLQRRKWHPMERRAWATSLYVTNFSFGTCLTIQRFARADKRAKLPRWINQYITENASNLSTDMALVLSKLFMRSISQNPNENQTGISLWTLEDVEKAQEKQRAALLEIQALAAKVGNTGDMEVDEDDEYGDGGLSDTILGEVNLDV